MLDDELQRNGMIYLPSSVSKLPDEPW